MPILLGVFFLSGLAGLLWEVVWVRDFGLTFGNTIYSASFVTGVLMAGLGIGAWLGGVIADRRYRKDRASGVRYYVLAEVGIALLGTAIAFILPRLEGLSASLSSYQTIASGWHVLSTGSYVVRYFVATALLGPVAILMGSSLTFLARALVHADLSIAGWRIGLLYGLNTAGAAIGSLLVDQAWIPALGIQSTQTLAAGLNLAAALGGAWFIRSRKAIPDLTPEPARATRPPAKRSRDARPSTPSMPEFPLGPILAAIFLAGFAGMGMEIVWFRFLTSALGQYRLVFSLLLFEILCGIGLGSIIAGALSRRSRSPVGIYLISQALLIVTVLGCIAMFSLDSTQATVRELMAQSGGDIGLAMETMIHLWTIFGIVGIPALLMGFAFPLASDLSVGQRSGASVGKQVGKVYLSNTLGACSGSLVAGFLLLPSLGMKWTTFVLMLVIVCSALVVLVPSTVSLRLSTPMTAWRGLAFAGSGVIVACALVAWCLTPSDYLILKSFRAHVSGLEGRDFARPPYLQARNEGLLETILVIDLPDRGRALFTNGHVMSLTGYSAQRYMRGFVHLPLLHMDRPETALVICFGVGNTAHACTLHPTLKRIEVVDISRDILRQAPQFAQTNGNVLQDRRVSVFVNDGRQHLRMQPEGSYDLVTLEPPPISFAGVGALYSKEFYTLVHSRLKSGGFLSQWLPIPQVPGPTALAMVRAFVDVFPNTILVNGDKGDFMMIGRKDAAITLSLEDVHRRLRDNPLVQEDLTRYGMGTTTEILGSFAADASTLVQATRNSAPVTDDLPLMEYAPVYRKRNDLAAGLIDVTRIASWCPTCFVDDRVGSEIADLPAYLSALGGMYSKLASIPVQGRPSSTPGPAWSVAVADLRSVAERYDYLKTLARP